MTSRASDRRSASRREPGEGLLGLMAIRHGESTANAAFAAAERDGRPLAMPGPDAAVELSERGRRQAAAVGEWLAGLPAGELPQVVRCSPYLRARQTWDIMADRLRAAGRPVPASGTDERLVDRRMGRLELMNPEAIRRSFPAAWTELRRDPFRYRPPGGESFADVAARLAGFLADAAEESAGLRVLVVAHDAVVLVLRHLIESPASGDLSALARYGGVANASVTTWIRRDGVLRLEAFNQTGHLADRPG